MTPIGSLHEDHESPFDRKPAARVTVGSISSAEGIANGIMTNKTKRLCCDDRRLEDHIVSTVPEVIGMVVQNVPLVSPDRQDWMHHSTALVLQDNVLKNVGDKAPAGVALAAASVAGASTGMVQGPTMLAMTHDGDEAARQAADGARADDVSMANRHTANEENGEWV